MSFMDEMLPETAETFGKMRDTIFLNGELDRKTKELIAVACSVLMRCQYCVNVHSQRAIDNGANKKDLAEAIAVAMFIAAGSQLGWTNDLGKSAYDLIFEDRGSSKEKGCGCGR